MNKSYEYTMNYDINKIKHNKPICISCVMHGRRAELTGVILVDPEIITHCGAVITLSISSKSSQ